MNFIDHVSKMPKLKRIKAMKKPELKDYLESRGFCCDGDSKKEMLEAAVDDWMEEQKGLEDKRLEALKHLGTSKETESQYFPEYKLISSSDKNFKG